MFGWKKKAPATTPIKTEDDAPPGEAEKVMQVKQLCWIAGMSAPYGNPASDEYETFAAAPDQQDYERDRYNKFRAKALRVADTLTDEFFRSGAINFIIDASMKAGDEDDARALLKQVKVDFIREKIVASYPRLNREPLDSVVRQR